MRARMGRGWLGVLLIVIGAVGAGAARERGPRVQVVCPSPPVPVRVADKQVLAYELQVTNLDMVPLTLKRLEVFPDAVTNPALRILSEDTLPAIIFSVGSHMGGKASSMIGPGAQDVLFLWIEMAPDAPAPSSLRHRMVFVPSAPGTAAPAEAILQDFPVPVSKAQPVLLSPPFDGGIWAGDGIANDTAHRRSLFAIDGHVHQPERFAIDWVKVGANGDARVGTARNEDWWGYGERLYAVADGGSFRHLCPLEEREYRRSRARSRAPGHPDRPPGKQRQLHRRAPSFPGDGRRRTPRVGGSAVHLWRVPIPRARRRIPGETGLRIADTLLAREQCCGGVQEAQY